MQQKRGRQEIAKSLFKIDVLFESEFSIFENMLIKYLIIISSNSVLYSVVVNNRTI